MSSLHIQERPQPQSDRICSVPVTLLGQSGCRLDFGGTIVFTDPYLSNSVQELDSPDLVRKIGIPFEPGSVTDADWVLITHIHIDHCDPHTLPKLAQASPQATFIGPKVVVDRLLAWGIEENRVVVASELWSDLVPGLRVLAVPAAHPELERDADGNLVAVGYIVEFRGRAIYLAGDTSVKQEVIDSVVRAGPVHTAFLPVNEQNFFRARRGIIGNMSVREAFHFALEIGARQVVPVHWDMFATNDVYPEEIQLVHRKMNPGFSLALKPNRISLETIQVSIIIRTLNESEHLGELLARIATQQTEGIRSEVVVVDSGSTDGTLEIARRNGCNVVHIGRDEFSFGRSLNVGCEAAHGNILVIISGHCVPVDECWLQQLCQPVIDGRAVYVYGRQLSGPASRFSEARIFEKYFPPISQIPQEGYFCNNANAAVARATWEKHKFNEDLTGLEDMDLAQRLISDGGAVAYVAEAAVFHHHNETWPQVTRRFEREAIALQKIMPQVHVNIFDMLRYFVASVFRDWALAKHEGRWRLEAVSVMKYRWCQYLGAYRGNHEHRKLSRADKEKYFFPA